MTHTLFLVFLILQFGVGQSSHKHLHEDHYVGQQHNPDRDIAVLLGEESTEEIKKLGLTEQKKKMMDIFKKIDRNDDNLLSPEEITVWIQHVYRKYALEDAEERFPEFDVNKDGIVTWEEYNSVAHGQLLNFDDDIVLEDPEQESLRHLLLKEKRRFDFADVDGTPGLNITEFLAFTHPSEVDGTPGLNITEFLAFTHPSEVDGTPGLNITEFLAFTHPSEVDYMTDFAIEDVLSEYDTNKDGFITLSEFIGNAHSEGDTPSQWEIEETVRFKELYDQDKDGRLNRDEQLRWVAPNSYGSAREEALHLIKEMDLDGDGLISVAEVLKNQETFMNSEVTDYGRQLHVSHDEL
uniref:Reticulocalbin-3 n=1 Tax=Iconisemion striatum TaxID=60296 RepID=A0A1A7WGQ0_9TELE